MFLKENVHWGEKVKEYENRAISKSIKESDSILIIRTLKTSSPNYQKNKQEAVNEGAPEIVLGGKNPNAGKISTIHTVKVLEVIKGSHKVGEELIINILEPEYRSGGGQRCWEPAGSVVNVQPMDETFKYLVYLNGHNVLRQNMFIEWHENIKAEEELALLKK